MSDSCDPMNHSPPGSSVQKYQSREMRLIFYTAQHAGSYLPDQRPNLNPLQWKHRSSTSGPPEKSTSGFSDAIILSPPPQVVAKPFLHHLSQSTFQESDHTFQKTSQNMTGVLGLGKQVLRKPYNSLVPRLGFPISNKLSWENKGNCAVTIALNNTLTFSFYNDVIVI